MAGCVWLNVFFGVNPNYEKVVIPAEQRPTRCTFLSQFIPIIYHILVWNIVLFT